jgi:glycosyltransferase involved in cell wall biosynthesis
LDDTGVISVLNNDRRRTRPLRQKTAGVCVVGSGTRFLSGISYYTHRLAITLAERYPVSVLLVRRMIPRWLYPGASRVGQPLTDISYPKGVAVLDGIDWFWGLSAFRSVLFVARHRPRFVVMQWWTGAVLHSWLLLAAAARLAGAKLVIEFHEVQDVGEQVLPLAGRYVNIGLPLLLRLSSAVVVHSDFDRAAIEDRYGALSGHVFRIPHGPYTLSARSIASTRPIAGLAPESPCRLLWFGVIRPFKGLDDLIEAFDSLSSQEVSGLHLTVIGETWEGFTQPNRQIAASPYRDRITFVNRYVTDTELAAALDAADAVVLPYHRSSSSGPLQMAMGCGLPVVVTSVGGLVEAAQGYSGALFVPPHDVGVLADALREVSTLRGRRFPLPYDWSTTLDGFEKLFSILEQIGS